MLARECIMDFNRCAFVSFSYAYIAMQYGYIENYITTKNDIKSPLRSLIMMWYTHHCMTRALPQRLNLHTLFVRALTKLISYLIPSRHCVLADNQFHCKARRRGFESRPFRVGRNLKNIYTRIHRFRRCLKKARWS